MVCAAPNGMVFESVKEQDLTYCVEIWFSVGDSNPDSCIQGRRDNHYTTGEPTVTADEIAQLILITSLRSRGRSLDTETLISLRIDKQRSEYSN